MKRQVKKGFLGILIAVATMAIALFAGCKNVNIDEWFCDHKYNDGTVIVDAGCTTDGTLERTCTGCGKKKKEPIIAVGHEFDEGEVVLEATCTTTGVKEYTCSRCGEVNTETLPMLPHNEVVFAGTPATCTETGMTEGRKCADCNTVLLAQSVIPAKGHKRVDDFAVSPTCTTTGLTYGYHCERCDEPLLPQEEIAALGHDVVTLLGYPATCTENGLTNGAKCNRCDTVYTEQEVIEALGHNVVTVAGHSATCTETGLTDKEYCARCNTVYAEQEVIAALGHVDSDTDGICDRCLNSYDLPIENMSGITYGYYRIYREAEDFTISFEPVITDGTTEYWMGITIPKKGDTATPTVIITHPSNSIIKSQTVFDVYTYEDYVEISYHYGTVNFECSEEQITGTDENGDPIWGTETWSVNATALNGSFIYNVGTEGRPFYKISKLTSDTEATA